MCVQLFQTKRTLKNSKTTIPIPTLDNNDIHMFPCGNQQIMKEGKDIYDIALIILF